VRCFFDTNVLLYQYDASAPHKQSVADALIKDTLANGELIISTQVMMEFYQVATRKFTRYFSSQHLRQLMHEFSAANPVIMTPDLIDEAVVVHQEHLLSWWDSTIVVAALHADADVLYSEDLQHGREFGNLQICNPFGSRVSERRPSNPSKRKR
jgi:predicted nucleic acid-binding protein